MRRQYYQCDLSNMFHYILWLALLDFIIFAYCFFTYIFCCLILLSHFISTIKINSTSIGCLFGLQKLYFSIPLSILSKTGNKKLILNFLYPHVFVLSPHVFMLKDIQRKVENHNKQITSLRMDLSKKSLMFLIEKFNW